MIAFQSKFIINGNIVTIKKYTQHKGLLRIDAPQAHNRLLLLKCYINTHACTHTHIFYFIIDFLFCYILICMVIMMYASIV